MAEGYREEAFAGLLNSLKEMPCATPEERIRSRTGQELRLRSHRHRPAGEKLIRRSSWRRSMKRFGDILEGRKTE